MKKLPIMLLILIFFMPMLSFAECTGNCKNGSGILKLSNGTKYVGNFKNGKYHGSGILTLPNGKSYVGEFRNGKFVKSKSKESAVTNQNVNRYNSNSVSNCNTNCINGKCTKTCCKNGKCTTTTY